MATIFGKCDRSSDGGFSLVEVLVAIVLVSALAVGVSRILSGGFKVLRGSQEYTDASAFAETIESRVKGMNFDDVYSFDTDQKNGTQFFNPNSYYFMDWSVSRASHTLIMLEKEMHERRFTRFLVEITYLRRDSSDQNAGSAGVVEEYVHFYDSADPNFCDDKDPMLCFEDCDGDTKYYSANACPNLTPETPDTGLKLMTISVFRGGNAVAVKQGTVLTKGGITGVEAPTKESPLKLDITFPPANTMLFSANTPRKRAALEVETIKPYPVSMSNTVFRVDNDPATVTINQNTKDPSAARTIPGGPPSYIRFLGTSEPGGELHFYYTTTGSLPPDNTTASTDTARVNGDGTIDVQASLDQLSFALSQPQPAGVWVRVSNGGLFSPFDARGLAIDSEPPVVTGFSPPEGLYGGGGLTPYIQVWVRDHPGASNFSGLCPSISAYKITSSALPGGQWELDPDEPTSPMNTRPVHRGISFVGGLAVIDENDFNLPPQLSPGTYTVRYEFGDYAYYKASHTWTFTIPNNFTSDADGPVISPPLKSDLKVDDGISVWYDPINPYTITLEPLATSGLRWFERIKMEDPESGIQYKTVKLECCSPTGVCHDVFKFDPTFPDFGLYFEFPLFLGHRYWYLPTYGKHVGHYFNQTNHTVGDWTLKITATNWAGLTTVNQNWKIRLQ